MKLVNIVGARPQFIKIGPILRAIGRHNRDEPDNTIQEILVHTGQHYDYEMSSIFFEELGLKEPDYHLGVGSGSHAYQMGEMLKRIEEVLLDQKPDVVLVYGDTNSTLDGAERVSLFGSCARRREDLFTHLDVLVVMRGEEPFVERVKGSQGMEKNITSGPSSKPVW